MQPPPDRQSAPNSASFAQDPAWSAPTLTGNGCCVDDARLPSLARHFQLEEDTYLSRCAPDARTRGTRCQPHELTGLNRTWGSAYLSARRTCRLGVLSAGRSAGRRYGLIRHPPLVLAEKTAGGTAVLSAGRSAGRRYGVRTFGRPEVRPYLWLAESAGRRYGLIRHPPL